MKCFSIFDKQAKFFSHPTFYASRGEAVAAFTGLVSATDKKTPHADFPSDYELFEVGTFDVVTGSFVPDLVRLGSGLDFKRVPNSPPSGSGFIDRVPDVRAN